MLRLGAFKTVLVVDSFQVFSCFSVDSNLLALLDKARNSDLETSLENSILCYTLNCIASCSVFCFRNNVDDLAWYLDVENLIFPKSKSVSLTILHDVLIAFEALHWDFDLLIVLNVHESEVFTIVVEILECSVFNSDVF